MEVSIVKVQDLMTDQVEIVSPDTGLENVARLMAENDIGSVPVCQDRNILGLITDRDIVIRAVAKGENPASMKAREVMSTDIISVSPDTDAHEAADTMSKYQIKRLPVVEDGRLAGIVALGDLAIENIHVDEAGSALNGISQGIRHKAH
jgi:CBS domain-containing protein